MEDEKRLADEFPNWALGSAIFSALQTMDVPWRAENISQSLDYEYIGNFSGQKFISPLVRKLNERTDITDEQRTTLLATIAFHMYKETWKKEYDTLSLNYNPLGGYNVTETMTNDTTLDTFGHSETTTNNLSHTKTGTQSETPNTTETLTNNLSHAKTGTEALGYDTTETRTDDLSKTKTGTDEIEYNTQEVRTPQLSTTADVYGFNSSVAQPANVQTTNGTETAEKTGTDTTTYNTTETNTGTQEVAKEGTDTTTFNTTDADTGTQTTVKTGTDTLTFNTTDADTGTKAILEGGSNSHTRNYTLQKQGTLGLVSLQKLVEDERNLWLWNYFQNIVFPDLDKILTIPIY